MDFETTLLQYSMYMTVIGFMLPPPTLHRRKYLDRRGDPSEEVTHQFYKQLYTNIVRDIDVSSKCMLSFQSCERGREGGKEVGVVEGEGGGTGEEWEGRWRKMRDGEEEEGKMVEGEG